MATTYYHFGGGPDDYARTPGTLILLTNQVLTITDPATGDVVTDLKDSGGNAVTQVSTDSQGDFDFYAPLQIVNIAVSGGRTYQVIAKSVLVQAAGLSNVAAQVQAAQAAAVAAQAAADAAAASAATAVQASTLGQPGGVATLDDTGELVDGQTPQSVLDRLSALETAGGGGRQAAAWDFTTADGSLAVNKFGKPSWFPFGGLFSGGVSLQVDAVGATALTVDFGYDTGAGFTSLYGAATKPTLPAGQTSSVSAAPPTQVIPTGSYVYPKLVTVPTGPAELLVEAGIA